MRARPRISLVEEISEDEFQAMYGEWAFPTHPTHVRNHCEVSAPQGARNLAKIPHGWGGCGAT